MKSREKEQTLTVVVEEMNRLNLDSAYEEMNIEIYCSVRETLATARKHTYKAVNFIMVEAYWEIGRQISEAQDDNPRAEYGTQLLKYLSERLTSEFGKGFDESNLRKFRQFYQRFSIRDALRLELSWTHYRLLMRVDEEARRAFYSREAAENNWSTRQLERQINSFYYERLLATQEEKRETIRNEIQQLEPKTEPDFIFKDPYILEFLDLKEKKDYHEKEIEQALIEHLQEFLLELGKGFAFVARQKRITLDGDHYYLDLVLYNYILKCFVVIDLKAGKLTYQDIGQIDFYVRYFDDKIKGKDDNPTVGILLCAEKNEAMAKYSVLSDKELLFASKYKLFLPTEEELQNELLRECRQIESTPTE